MVNLEDHEIARGHGLGVAASWPFGPSLMCAWIPLLTGEEVVQELEGVVPDTVVHEYRAGTIQIAWSRRVVEARHTSREPGVTRNGPEGSVELLDVSG